MIIDDFMKYGLEGTDKAISEIPFSDCPSFWANFRWKNYGTLFILFEYNRFYGFIVRQIATNDFKWCSSSGGIGDLVKDILKIESDKAYFTEYEIDRLIEAKQ